MTEFKTMMLGVVSDGTLKEVDLAQALLTTYYKMRTLGYIAYKQVDALHVIDLEFFRRMILRGCVDMSEEFIMEEFWFHYHEVEKAINEVCVQHDCYYESHPDDPACIGIWELDEE